MLHYLGYYLKEMPTYNELIDETPRLAPLFKLNEEFKESNSLNVTRMGVEPMIFGMKARRPRPLDERALSVTAI